MTLDHAIADMKLRGNNPASNVRFPPMGETGHVYLTAVEVAKLAELCDTAAGEGLARREARRRGGDPGLHRIAVR
jgi:hypothetical protein